MSVERDVSLGETLAVIIDAAHGARHLDNTRSSPTSLKTVESKRTVLDWVLHALVTCGIEEVTYVGGYHIQKVIQGYPNLSYRFHANWRIEGEVAGLRLAVSTNPGGWMIMRSNTLCTPKAVRILTAHQDGVAAGYYGEEPQRKFCGMIALSASVATAAFAVADSICQRSVDVGLEDWLAALVAEGLPVRQVTLDSFASPVSDPIALARTVFGGKGRTLEQVRPLIRSAAVLDQIRFSAERWRQDAAAVMLDVRRAFPHGHLAVRSSSSSEDSLDVSEAGRFKSVLDVPVTLPDRLRAAIDEVAVSFSNDGRASNAGDEILVQPHLGNLAASGVLFTRDIETGAPYYVLNVDRESGRSDTVTSGTKADIATVYVARDSDVSDLEADVQACITLARELERLTHLDDLDIEFGIDRDGQTYLFQVRPIAARARKFQLADEDLTEELGQVRAFLDARLRPHPALFGETTVLGTMPDWNPAEMIGTAPRPLALSLYQRLIGNEAWATARSIIGYRDVRPEPLIVSLGGRPYVDVRASLNSFLPRGLDDATAAPWVNHCLGILHQNGQLHDKIEFEVAITCLTFDFERHAERLRLAGLGQERISEFRTKLLRLTDSVLTGEISTIDSQLACLHELGRRREYWLDQPVLGSSGLARRINVLLAECEKYGVIPFAVLARYAFICTSLLRSLRSVGVFSDEECETLLGSIPTIASELSRDMAQHRSGHLSTETLLERYGHLRPGSYDIASPNYNSSASMFATDSAGQAPESSFPEVSTARGVFDAHAVEIERLLAEHGFTASADQLREFLFRAIPARERAKFEFMKSVDAALENTAQLGCELGFSRDDMSFLPVDQVVRGALDSPSGAVRMEFRRSIEFNKKRWGLTAAIRLPHLVRSLDDLSAFRQESWTPNFVSSKRVVAPPAVLETGSPTASLKDRIVLIRAADPGFDWIFGHPIAGLVTEYGGVASHMAIRAAEFGLPAAIGCGELIFNRLLSARLIELDCTSKRVHATS